MKDNNIVQQYRHISRRPHIRSALHQYTALPVLYCQSQLFSPMPCFAAAYTHLHFHQHCYIFFSIVLFRYIFI